MQIETTLIMSEEELLVAIQLFVATKGYSPDDVCSYSLSSYSLNGGTVRVILTDKKV